MIFNYSEMYRLNGCQFTGTVKKRDSYVCIEEFRKELWPIFNSLHFVRNSNVCHLSVSHTHPRKKKRRKIFNGIYTYSLWMCDPTSPLCRGTLSNHRRSYRLSQRAVQRLFALTNQCQRKDKWCPTVSKVSHLLFSQLWLNALEIPPKCCKSKDQIKARDERNER